MSEQPVIQLKNISKTYHTGKVSFEALKNINLEIQTGAYMSILGPSGSGKSTLMQIIGCLSTPTSGSYVLSGKEVSQLSRNDLARIRGRKIGFVFQSFNLLSQINIVDNVALPLVYQGVSTGKREKLAKELLTKLGLGTHLDHRPSELSGGQKQRVAIARALVTDPDVILADEPTGNLDSKSGDEVIKTFEQFVQEGSTIIIVTHDISLANRTKSIIRLRDGGIVED